ncbi:MAG: metalloregulator ArsR/SmtB family transcription factor [Mesorhizobium sp.]
MNVVSSDTRFDASADAHAMAAKLAALSHPVRIEILRHLSARSACCCRDVVERIDLAQSTVSQHLKVLVAAGLVRYAAEGQRSRYTVDREALAALSRGLSELVDSCCAGR